MKLATKRETVESTHGLDRLIFFGDAVFAIWVQASRARLLVTPAVFLGSIGVSFLSPGLAELSWILVWAALAASERAWKALP